jgi:AcrR family transcriptional regulator/predicted DNA-binding transcriptional regulator AlpA
MPMKTKWLKMNELSTLSGISRPTIHYYLRENLLPPPVKTGKTMSLYTSVHLECLAFIRDLRENENTPISIIRDEVRKRYGSKWKDSTARESKNSTARSKGEAQRYRIIEKAIDLFSERGYHSTQISDITDALNLSKGTFYLYFKQKNDLIICVFDEIIKNVAKIEETITNDPDPISRIIERAKAYHPFFLKYHKIIDIARAESLEIEQSEKLNLRTIYGKILNQVAHDIRLARETGIIHDDKSDPELLSYIFLGALDFALFRMLMDSSYTFEGILDTLKNLFIPNLMKKT